MNWKMKFMMIGISKNKILKGGMKFENYSIKK